MTGPTDPETEEDFAALLAESESESRRQRPLRVGEVVRGRVVAIGAPAAFVAIGGKAEGTIELSEFRDPETDEVRLSVGDQIEATVIDDGRRSGSIVLKRTLGRGGHVPGELEQALEHGIAVEGVVTAQNKGGFDVQVAGQRAFCPGSQIDVRRSGGAQYVGQRLRFKVARIEGGGRNIVLSRRALLEEEGAKQAEETWKRLEVGAVVEGSVTSIRDFGAFVDIGGVEGLVHVSELGYGRPGHPSEVLAVGERVRAQVVKIAPDPSGAGRARVGLSLRALAPDPWRTASERFLVGTTVRGTVRRLEPFGAFVEIAPGLDGLVHVSRLSVDRRVSHPRQVVTPGQQVEATVVEVDAEKRRIGLSMVESARRAKQEGERDQSGETAAALERSRESKSLGTFADLLAASRKRKD